MNRWLGGLKTAGTTFGWSAGDQRVDIQLAPGSKQFLWLSVGSHSASHFHHQAVEVTVCLPQTCWWHLIIGEQLICQVGKPKSRGINLGSRPTWSSRSSVRKDIMFCTWGRIKPCIGRGWEAAEWPVDLLIRMWLLQWMPEGIRKQPSSAPWLQITGTLDWTALLSKILYLLDTGEECCDWLWAPKVKRDVEKVQWKTAKMVRWPGHVPGKYVMGYKLV